MESFSELNPKAQFLTFAILGAALLFAGEYTLLMPMSGANQKTAAQARQLEAKNSALAPLQGRLRQVQGENRRLQRQWTEVQAMLPTQTATDDFLRQMQGAAQQTGVQLSEIIAKKTKERPNYEAAPYALTLQGSYRALLRFYDRLAAMPRIVGVSDVSLSGLPATASAGSAGGGGETVHAQCRLTTYFQPLNRPAAPGAGQGAHR